MDRQCGAAQPIGCALCAGLALLGACSQGTRPGSLVGSYTVHGVLVENTCGQAALPAANPLNFKVEVRQQASVAYWIASQSQQATGTLSSSGMFRFSMSQTQVLDSGTSARQLQPSDFQSMQGDFDLQRKPTCALTQKQTVQGSLQRRLVDGAVSQSTGDAGSTASEDLSAEHLIEITPSAGSDCNAALAALGGSFLALPCDARYVLSGTLDATSAVSAGSAATAAKRSDAGDD